MFLFLFLFSFHFSLRSQNDRIVFVDDSDKIVQLLMLNEQRAIALAKGTGKFKLVNTLLLIENGTVKDRLVHKGSLDYVRIVDEEHFNVFRPTASLVNVYVEDGKLVLGETEKIPYDKIIWSTNFEEAVLTTKNGVSVAFNQGSEEFSLNPDDSDSTPFFKLFFDENITDLNTPNDPVIYTHWPSYKNGVMPPMNLVRVIDEDIFIVLSNLGEYYQIDTKSKSYDRYSFPKKSGVKSWSLLYDHIKDNYFFVAYNEDNSYDFFKKENSRDPINKKSIKDFSDVIVNNQLLIKRKIKNGYSYSLKSLRN